MDNKTIQYPFCLKESQRGNGYMATILYGVYPHWYSFVSFGLLALIGISTDMAGSTISFPIIAVVGCW